MGSDMVEPKDATEIECTLWNASISGCNDALPTLHSSNDNEDEGGEEDQGDARTSNNLSFDRIGSTGTLHESDSNLAECSGQGNEEQHTKKEGHKAVGLLVHDIDPYKDAMHDDLDGGFYAFLSSKPQSFDPNIPQGKVYIHFTYSFNFKSVWYLSVNMFCLPQLFILVVSLYGFF